VYCEKGLTELIWHWTETNGFYDHGNEPTGSITFDNVVCNWGNMGLRILLYGPGQLVVSALLLTCVVLWLDN
jgi:hypothetical protein